MDIAVIVLNALSCEYTSLFYILNKVLLPCWENETAKRTIIALNQCDLLMHRDYWERWNSNAYEELRMYMKEKRKYAEENIFNNTGLDIKTVCYSAGYKEQNEPQKQSYNLEKLLWKIIQISMK